MGFIDSLRLVGTDEAGKVFHEQVVNERAPSADGESVGESWARDRRQDREFHEVIFPDGRPPHRHTGRLTDLRGHGSDKPELRAAREQEKQRRQTERAGRKAIRDEEYRRRASGPE